jgi:hypothetical protein
MLSMPAETGGRIISLKQWRSQDFTAGYSTYKKFSMHMCNSNRGQNQYKIDPDAQLK